MCRPTARRKNLGEAFALNFTVKTTATGTATVAVTSAKIDKSANAVAKDAPEAKLLDAGNGAHDQGDAQRHSAQHL